MPETALRLTVREAVLGAARVLTEAGCESPRLDAELLLGHVLGAGRAALVLDADSELDQIAADRFAALVSRRVAREPVAYILGRKEFRRVTLAVDPRVLIPRPETELLVEVGLSLPAGARVVDVGTGSGAVALALKDERPDLEVWGSDLSRDALAVAQVNSERLNLDVHWLQGDLLDGVPGGFDAGLANLPYVAVGAPLAPEITGYEPPAALFAGPDGLDDIRRLADQAAGRLPLLALEVGLDQGQAVSGLLRQVGFGSVEILADLAGHDRVVVGRR
ncbi:MAG: peptide chain release factor N(5)-glutamine methyltransferase [Solirubrobacterales bacterium]|nr:peptide chain release factor N(5)-glutamine methyltransferase [Solirubrobacterales bacterium]